jgi:hypothetical protein
MSTEALSIVAGTFVGVAGITAGALTARGQRTHAERLARQSHMLSRRGDAYVEVLAAVRRQTYTIQNQSRLLRSPDDPPPPLPVEQDLQFHLDALVAAFGSEPVRAALREWSEACHDFYYKTEEAEDSRPSPTEEMWAARGPRPRVGEGSAGCSPR